MDPKEFCSKLEGVIGFPVTPFRKDCSLDLDGHRENVNHMLEEPLCALVAAGGTGELYSLTPEEHRLVVESTVQEARGRAPIIAGVGFSGGLAVEVARQSTDCGAAGVLAFPPYYPNAHMDGLLEYYASIGQASGLGVVVYSRDWAHFTPGEAERLAEVPGVVAWKEGQADIRRYQMIRQQVGDRLHWIGGAGDDMVPGYYSIGIRAYTSSISAIAPKLAVRLHEAGVARDTATLNSLVNEHVVPLYSIRLRRKGYEVSAMKAMMNLTGLAGGKVRPPLVAVTDGEKDELQVILNGWKTAGFC